MDNDGLKGWNHVPTLPLKVSPFFRWPLRPLEMVAWIWNSWFLITETLILVCIAILSFSWFPPPLPELHTLAFVCVLYVLHNFSFVVGMFVFGLFLLLTASMLYSVLALSVVFAFFYLVLLRVNATKLVS